MKGGRDLVDSVVDLFCRLVFTSMCCLSVLLIIRDMSCAVMCSVNNRRKAAKHHMVDVVMVDVVMEVIILIGCIYCVGVGY